MQDPSPEPPQPGDKPELQEVEQDVGDFIARQVLDKDAVFFEG